MASIRGAQSGVCQQGAVDSNRDTFRHSELAVHISLLANCIRKEKFIQRLFSLILRFIGDQQSNMSRDGQILCDCHILYQLDCDRAFGSSSFRCACQCLRKGIVRHIVDGGDRIGCDRDKDTFDGSIAVDSVNVLLITGEALGHITDSFVPAIELSGHFGSCQGDLGIRRKIRKILQACGHSTQRRVRRRHGYGTVRDQPKIFQKTVIGNI